jgi:hypothetical protein
MNVPACTWAALPQNGSQRDERNNQAKAADSALNLFIMHLLHLAPGQRAPLFHSINCCNAFATHVFFCRILLISVRGQFFFDAVGFGSVASKKSNFNKFSLISFMTVIPAGPTALSQAPTCLYFSVGHYSSNEHAASSVQMLMSG